MVEFNPINPADNSDTTTYSTNVSGGGRVKKTGTIANAMKRLSDKVNGKNNSQPAKPTPLTKEEFIQAVNDMSDDTARIVAYNKQNYHGDYYGIIDKKSCKLKIYDKQGNVVKTYPVGIGKNKGDHITYGYDSQNWNKKEAGRFTTPGEFTLDEYQELDAPNYISRRDGKHKLMALKGDNIGSEGATQAIHMVPNNRRERVHRLETETPDDNRVSYGCVNLLEDDYDDMAKYLGEGNKIFILPEENGNKLQLEKQQDGSYKFVQQYHKNDERGMSAEEASKVDYDIRPENDPSRRNWRS